MLIMPGFYRSLLLALSFLLLGKSLVSAPITCTPTHVGSVGDVSSLVACIIAANAATDDTIIDLGGANYTLLGTTLYPADGANGLPNIINKTNTITIENGSIERSLLSGTPNFRILHVASAAHLELLKVSIENGYIAGSTPSSNDNGGAIYNLGTLGVENSTLSSNTANNFGGAIFNSGAGVIEIVKSTISGNTALDSSEGNGGGGGIYNIATINCLVDSTISGNRTPGFGGGINNQALITKIYGSTISGNQAVLDIAGGSSATGAGGGIFNDFNGIISLLIDSTVSGNSAYEGGGIYNNGTIGISNSTISLNIANNGGGGIYNNNPGIISKLFSTVVDGNTDTQEYSIATPDIKNLGSITSENFNLIGDNSGVPTIVNGMNNDIVGVDPLLGPLQDNGGPTFTMALLPGSLAINNGDNPFGIEFDQREAPFLRVANGRPDIGAYELQGCADSDDDGACDEFDNCPFDCNQDQLDSDGDSIGDVCDNCPLNFNPDQDDDACSGECGDGDEWKDNNDEVDETEEIIGPLPSPPFLHPYPIVGPAEAPLPVVSTPQLEDAPGVEIDISSNNDKEDRAKEKIAPRVLAPTISTDEKDSKGSGCSLIDHNGQTINNIWLIMFLSFFALRNLAAKRKVIRSTK